MGRAYPHAQFMEIDKIWLSILIPSIRPHSLMEFTVSLFNNVNGVSNGIELVIERDPKLNVVQAIERCLNKAKADWIWVANDDLICETKGWDAIFYRAINKYSDGIAMFYPNDNIFNDTFPCFPLVRKDMIRRLFPSPFEKYKIDDSIRDVFPRNRRIYLDNVMMKHTKVVDDKYDYDAIKMKNDYIQYMSDEQMSLRDDILRENMNKMLVTA